MWGGGGGEVSVAAYAMREEALTRGVYAPQIRGGTGHEPFLFARAWLCLDVLYCSYSAYIHTCETPTS